MTWGPPASPRALLQTGLQLLQQRRIQEAERAFDAAVRLDPDNAQAHHMVGLLALQSGRLQAGVESLRTAVRLDPSDPAAHGNLANGLRDWGWGMRLWKPMARPCRLIQVRWSRSITGPS